MNPRIVVEDSSVSRFGSLSVSFEKKVGGFHRPRGPTMKWAMFRGGSVAVWNLFSAGRKFFQIAFRAEARVREQGTPAMLRRR